MTKRRVRTLEDLEAVVAAEARAGGPAALAALHAERERYRLARDIVELRKERRLTQTQLSVLAGVHQSEISKIESGSINASQGTYARLFFALEHELRPIRVKALPAALRRSATRRKRGS